MSIKHVDTLENFAVNTKSSSAAPKFRTISAYVSGAICGHLWMPQTLAGTSFRKCIRSEMARSGENSFRGALVHILMENGGDFQNAQFSADSALRVERKAWESAYVYKVHVREIAISDLPDCHDLVNTDAYTADFLSD